MISFLKMCT